MDELMRDIDEMINTPSPYSKKPLKDLDDDDEVE